MPPPQHPRRFDADPGRPATIRIEANTRPPLPPRRGPDLPQAPEQLLAPGTDTIADRLQALVLSQGLLLNAFVLLLVFGWTSPLPGRRYLLGAFALGGIVVAVLIHFALRGARRRTTAERPRAAGGTTRFGDWFGKAAVRALPAALVTGWIALGIYALALPPNANAFQESRPGTGVPSTNRTNARPAPRSAAPAGNRSTDSAASKDPASAQPAKRTLFSW